MQFNTIYHIQMEVYFLTCTIYQHILLMLINQSIIHVVFPVPAGSWRFPDGSWRLLDDQIVIYTARCT